MMRRAPAVGHRLACAGAVAVVFAFAAPARAEHKRAGVPKFDGAQEALVRRKVTQALKAHGYDVVTSRQIAAAADKLGVQLDTDDAFQKLAAELGLAVIVTGDVGPKRAKLVVHDGHEGSVLGASSFSAADAQRLALLIGKELWRKLGDDVGRGRAPEHAKKPQLAAESDDSDERSQAAAAAPPAPAPSADVDTGTAAAAPAEQEQEPPRKKAKKRVVVQEEAPPAAEADASSEPTTAVFPTFDVDLGPGGLTRNLSFHQNQSGLLPYSLGVGTAVIGHAVWYPLALVTGGALSNLGVEGTLEQEFAISSQIGAGVLPAFPNGATFGTTVHEYAGGLRYRFPFGAGSEVYVSATGGEQAYVFTSKGGNNRAELNELPDTIYRYLRGGLGVRLALPARLSLRVGGGYRLVLNNGGQIHDVFFPRSTVAGVDAALGLGYRITDNVEVRAGAELRRYFYSMNSRAGDAFIAGGAVDQYISFDAALAVSFGGAAPVAPEPAEEAPAPPPPAKEAKRKPRPTPEPAETDDADKGSGGRSTDAPE